MRIVISLCVGLLALALGLIGLGYWQIVRHQPSNVPASASKSSFGHSLPSLEATSLAELIEHQGYLHASERLWQMDLMRRSVFGRLSEWFGARTLGRDRLAAEEDWPVQLLEAVDRLARDQKDICQSYARGVNRYIHDARQRWSIEYTLLGATPEPWICAHTLGVLFLMASDLTASAEMDLHQENWRSLLSKEWQNFLFPVVHPWSAPYFGRSQSESLQIPPRWQHLPQNTKKLGQDRAPSLDPMPGGSNAWAWSFRGTTLLATDPHLAHRVPQLWFPMTLQAPDFLATGSSLPGLPGIVMGRNRQIAWSFTNLGDDVDDYVFETLNKSKDEYAATIQGGKTQWLRIAKKEVVIRVKGETDVKIQVMRTHRGPMKKVKWNEEDRFVSRQWLALKPGVLRLPTLKVNAAKDWSEFNRALDDMIVPGQMAIFADASGNIGMRVTGVAIKRPPGDTSVATEAEWTGLGQPQERYRMLLPPRSDRPVAIVHANAQIWEDTRRQRWMSDDRRRRISHLLKQSDAHSVQSMREIQLDTHSDFYEIQAQWLAKYGDASKFADTLQVLRLSTDSRKNAKGFALAKFVEEELVGLLLSRVQEHFYKGVSVPTYQCFLRRAWLLSVFTDPEGSLAFGLSPSELANALLEAAVRSGIAQSGKANLWSGAHPFESLPWIGWLFAVDHFEQKGSPYAVRAEGPKHGPSMRMVMHLQDSQQDWAAWPVGLSGHIGSPQFNDWQPSWSQQP